MKRIYFAQNGNNPEVKIGYTNKFEKRMAQLQTGNPNKINVINIIYGNAKIEHLLHNKLKHEHIQGEWFNLTPEILTFIHSIPREWNKTQVEFIENYDLKNTAVVKEKTSPFRSAINILTRAKERARNSGFAEGLAFAIDVLSKQED